MELKDRVLAAREFAKLTQEQLAKAVGMTQQSFQALEAGDTKSSRKLVKIALRCGVDPVWLDTGEGEMIQSQAMRDWSGRIDSRRLAAGLSVQEVHTALLNHAWPAGVIPPSLETVGNWFSGNERPKEMYLQALYAALGMDLDEATKGDALEAQTAEEQEALRRFRGMTPEQRMAQLLVWKANDRGDG